MKLLCVTEKTKREVLCKSNKVRKYSFICCRSERGKILRQT